MNPMDKDTMVDELCKAMEQDENVQALYDVWSLIKSVPSRAVDILIQFQDVSTSAKDAVEEMRKTLSDVKTLKDEMETLKEGVEFLGQFRSSVMKLDEDVVMNRLSRLLNMASQIRKLKHDGSLELIEGLLSK